MRRSVLFAILATASVSSASAQDCLTADYLASTTNGPGPFWGGSFNFPMSNTPIEMWIGTYYDSNGVPATSGSPEFGPAPFDCGNTSSMVLVTHINNLYAILAGSPSTVEITFCDGANDNNASGRVSSIDFRGDIAGADGQTMPGPFGTQVDVRVTPPADDPRVLTFASQGVSQFVFGGAETMIAQICIR